MKEYYLVPKMGSVFEVTPDCCFKQVIFEGQYPTVKYCMDDEYGIGLSSWDLQCYSCNPKLEIIPITKQFFDDKRAFVDALNSRQHI